VESPDLTYKDADVNSYAQYGTTSGRFKLSETKTCVILSQGWPSWFWAALARGYVIKLVILSNSLWKTIILKHSPSTKVLVWAKDLEIPWEQVYMVFSDFDLKGRLRELWMYVTHLVILPKATCSHPEGWHSVKLLLSHWELGGVTDCTWIRHVYYSHLVLSITVQRQAARDASTILNAMESGGYPCKAPQNLSSGLSCGPELCILREGVFHGRGLLPWMTQRPRVVTTNVFSPTRWVCRKISLEERLYSHDLTKLMLKYMNQKNLELLATDDGYLPDKCCLELLDTKSFLLSLSSVMS